MRAKPMLYKSLMLTRVALLCVISHVKLIGIFVLLCGLFFAAAGFYLTARINSFVHDSKGSAEEMEYMSSVLSQTWAENLLGWDLEEDTNLKGVSIANDTAESISQWRCNLFASSRPFTFVSNQTFLGEDLRELCPEMHSDSNAIAKADAKEMEILAPHQENLPLCANKERLEKQAAQTAENSLRHAAQKVKPEFSATDELSTEHSAISHFEQKQPS